MTPAKEESSSSEDEDATPAPVAPVVIEQIVVEEHFDNPNADQDKVSISSSSSSSSSSSDGSKSDKKKKKKKKKGALKKSKFVWYNSIVNQHETERSIGIRVVLQSTITLNWFCRFNFLPQVYFTTFEFLVKDKCSIS